MRRSTHLRTGVSRPRYTRRIDAGSLVWVWVAVVVVGAVLAAWRSGWLARRLQRILPEIADRAWAIPGLGMLMARGWQQRVKAFASYEMQAGDVVMLGDSITAGADWEALLPGVRVHNHGIGGDDTDGVLRRLTLVTDSRPGTVFLMIGTNDIGKGVHSVGEIVDNVATIVDRIGSDSPTTEIHVQSVLPRLHRRADQVARVNQGIETVARDRGVTWIDLRPIFDRGDGGMDLRLAPDALHPNAEGNRRWAEFIAPFCGGAGSR
jgi:lysophospholipase L1-like esterase